MDLSKAFDTLDHNILLHKLRHYGIRGTCLALLKSYLSERKQFVEFNGVKFSLANITTGVPQGSILGPLLFIIYTNDISNACDIFKSIVYADDTTLMSTLSAFNSHGENTVSDNINELLAKIDVKKSKFMLFYTVSDNIKAELAKINVKKSKFMLFYMPGRNLQISNLHVNNIKLECLDSFNFLGITIDTHLTWEEHINLIANNISRTVDVIDRLKNYIPENALLTIYNTLIIPHLNYGILTWEFITDKILKIHKKAVRSITLSKYNAHTEPIFKTLKLLKINDIFRCQTLKFCYKLINGNLPVYFNHGDWYSPIGNIHCYNTRGQNKLFIYRKNHEFAKRCLLHEVIITFNNTPLCIMNKIHTH